MRESARAAADDLAQPAAADEQIAIGLLRSRGVAVPRLTPTGRAAFAFAARAALRPWAVRRAPIVGAAASGEQGRNAVTARRTRVIRRGQPTKRPRRTAVSPFFGRRVGMISTQSA